MTDYTDGPDFEVWNHLEQTIQNIQNEMDQRLQPNTIRILEGVATLILSLRLGTTVNPGLVDIPADLAKLAPKVEPKLWKELALALAGEPANWVPWLRQAVELQIAQRGIGRSVQALERYTNLRAQLVGRRLPERARPYIDQSVECYLFGFDAACIALTCSSFEQLAKHTLVALGAATEPELNRPDVSAEGLRIKLRTAGVLSTANDAAVRLVSRRNRLLHRGFGDVAIHPTESLDSIRELVDISVELAPSWPAA